jgi:beta-xylosidase
MTIGVPPSTTRVQPWNDVTRSAADRVEALMTEMTLREKVAQLYGLWIGASMDGDGVAPHQNDLGEEFDLEEMLGHGLGQLTRWFGTNPVDPGEGAVSLARTQRHIMAANRFGIPALVHEECLAGFTTWGATAYPVPLAWGATFNPVVIEEMGRRIGTGMRSVGAHQGLAPVLDVTRDYRWGRTEETIGEDPYLVGRIASAYITGLEDSGVIATLKHFAGYSGSKSARNLAPVSLGRRELIDVILAPFEMAVQGTGIRSVMHSYSDIDGVPSAADEHLLTTLLRDTWGFEGTVVADYFGVSFLKLLHGIADTWGDAARLALTAGVDVELPSMKAYGEPLVAEVTDGRVDEALVDRALRRVLLQKVQLGLLDPDWNPVPSALRAAQPAGTATTDAAGSLDADPVAFRGTVDLDTESDRTLARVIAEQSVVLLRNRSTLPLAATTRRIAVIGPVADDAMTVLGCYSFPSHVGVHHPEFPMGVDIPTIVESLGAEFSGAEIGFAGGCSIDGPSTAGFDAALASTEGADVVILCVGDRAGLFGRGTSGEGCDAETLDLPGVQSQLVERVLDTGATVVLVVVSGRPYSLGTAPQRAAAVVQTFFPGEEGPRAIAGVLSGRVNPSGRLPVSVPSHPGSQPWTYLGAKLTRKSEVSNIDTTPAYPFGFGLGYSPFGWGQVSVEGAPFEPETMGESDVAATVPTDGTVRVGIIVTNEGDRDGDEIVQLYLHDPVASVVQPVRRLIGFARVELAAGASADVEFEVPLDVSSFTGVDYRRIVEPGRLELLLGDSSENVRARIPLDVRGEVRVVDHTRELHCGVSVQAR